MNKRRPLERMVLFDYLLLECDHQERTPGETHWHVAHAGSGAGICVCTGKTEATVIAYGLALYDKLSVSEQLQILGEATSDAAEQAVIETITPDELLAYLEAGFRHDD